MLVVDDDRDHVDSLVRLVAGAGIATQAAYSGNSALVIAEQFRPHLALLDLGMPVLNGFLLAKRFRQIEALDETRLVAVSGFVDQACRTLAADAGFDDFLVKPYSKRSIDALLEHVSRCLLASVSVRSDSSHLRELSTELRAQVVKVSTEAQALVQSSRELMQQATDESGQNSFEVQVGQTYWVHWAGEDFQVRVRGHGVVQPGSWVGSRLDTNQPIVLPTGAFRRLAE